LHRLLDLELDNPDNPNITPISKDAEALTTEIKRFNEDMLAAEQREGFEAAAALLAEMEMTLTTHLSPETKKNDEDQKSLYETISDSIIKIRSMTFIYHLRKMNTYDESSDYAAAMPHLIAANRIREQEEQSSLKRPESQVKLDDEAYSRLTHIVFVCYMAQQQLDEDTFKIYRADLLAHFEDEEDPEKEDWNEEKKQAVQKRAESLATFDGCWQRSMA
jgi:hypothetical protein